MPKPDDQDQSEFLVGMLRREVRVALAKQREWLSSLTAQVQHLDQRFEPMFSSRQISSLMSKVTEQVQHLEPLPDMVRSPTPDRTPTPTPDRKMMPTAKCQHDSTEMFPGLEYIKDQHIKDRAAVSDKYRKTLEEIFALCGHSCETERFRDNYEFANVVRQMVEEKLWNAAVATDEHLPVRVLSESEGEYQTIHAWHPHHKVWLVTAISSQMAAGKCVMTVDRAGIPLTSGEFDPGVLQAVDRTKRNAHEVFYGSISSETPLEITFRSLSPYPGPPRRLDLDLFGEPAPWPLATRGAGRSTGSRFSP